MRLLVCFVLMFLVAILFMVLGKVYKAKYVTILGVIVALDVVCGIVVNMFFYYRNADVSVIGMDSKEFSVQIQNYEDLHMNTYSCFATKLTLDEVTEQIKKKYGHVNAFEGGLQIVDGVNAFTLTELREEKVFADMRYQYRLKADFVELPDLKRGEEKVKVVFPGAAIPEGTDISKVMACAWDMKQVKAYYTNVPNAKVMDDSVEIDGVRITVKDKKVFFELIL